MGVNRDMTWNRRNAIKKLARLHASAILTDALASWDPGLPLTDEEMKLLEEEIEGIAQRLWERSQ